MQLSGYAIPHRRPHPLGLRLTSRAPPGAGAFAHGEDVVLRERPLELSDPSSGPDVSMLPGLARDARHRAQGAGVRGFRVGSLQGGEE